MKIFLLLFSFLFSLVPTISAQDQWSWMSGQQGEAIQGTYGTMGVEDPSNEPGSRFGAATWTDADGNFWLFGGEGLAGNNQPVRLAIGATPNNATLNVKWKRFTNYKVRKNGVGQVEYMYSQRAL